MIIQVNPHKIILTKTNDVNSGEYNVNECVFEFSQEFDNLTCIAVFSLCDGTTRNITILNNRCIIPTEVLQQTGQVKIGVYGYSVQDDELVLRYSPTPQIFVVTEGSYKEGTEPVAPTPTDWEILVEQVSDNSRDISNIQEEIGDINADIVNINAAIDDLDDKKANINDLSAVAFSGSYNDLINKPNLSVYATKTDLSDEATLRENADVALQEQIDAISVSSDVVDVVGTYQELLNYDTQHLKDNDIVKVLDDSTHNNALSYYRWDKESQTWSYIGSEGPFYTKAETQELLNAKENKITTTNKLDADLVDDSNSTNKFVTEEDITYWDNKEDKSNKVTEINSSSTDTQYPSAKCVYDSQVAQDNEIDTLKMIYNILPTDTDTGETISIDNTGEMPIKSIQLGGNTSQVVIPAETGTNVNATSISISDVDTDKEHYFELDGNTYQETTSISGGDEYDSPSPDHPQPIEVVTGENTIVISNSDNSQSQSYQINLGNIELCKISTYKDRIYKSNDKWYLEKKTGKVTLNGSEDWNIASNDIFYITDITDYATSGNIPFSNYFVGLTNKGSATTFKSDGTDLRIGFNTNSAIPRLFMRYDAMATTTNLQQWLSTHNTIVYYALATPTTTEITDTTLVSQLNALANSTLYSTTNINTDTSNLLPYIDLQYNVVTPSPSPSRPSVVNVVKGENTLTICGKNLFNNNTITNNKQVYSSGQIIDNNNVFTTDYINVSRFSNFTIKCSTSGNINYCFYNSKKERIGGGSNAMSGDTFANGRTLQVVSNAYYMRVAIPKTATGIMIEGGSTASTYEPYKSQTYPINLPSGMELCKISTYQDYFYKENGNWYKHSEIGKVVLNGSESIALDTTKTITQAFSIPNVLSRGVQNNLGICNYFITQAGDTEKFSYLVNVVDYGTLYIAINKTTASTIQEFKNWLSTHNTTVYYPVATPTNTQITDTTLINQLDNLQKAISYDSQTNISQTNEDKPFIITAEMFLSLKNVLN